jgi:transcription antitermination factor NusG
MTADPSGMQEPFEPEFHFSKGQGVRIVEGPFTEFVGESAKVTGNSRK